jgi:hypothetical protein
MAKETTDALKGAAQNGGGAAAGGGSAQNGKPSNRARLAERFKKNNPEFNADDDETLWGAAADQLDKDDEAAEQRKRFNEAISKSDIAPEMMTGLLSGKNADGSPFNLEDYLFDKHKDFFLDYLEDKDGAMDKLKARKAERQKEADDEAKFEAERDGKIKKEDAELDAAIKESGYKQAQVKKLIDWIYDGDKGFVARASRFELTKDDFLRLFRIKDWDAKMKEAEDNGYRRGKNERIDMFAHNQERRRKLPPDNAGGGGKPLEGGEDPTLAALNKMKNAY